MQSTSQAGQDIPCMCTAPTAPANAKAVTASRTGPSDFHAHVAGQNRQERSALRASATPPSHDAGIDGGESEVADADKEKTGRDVDTTSTDVGRVPEPGRTRETNASEATVGAAVPTQTNAAATPPDGVVENSTPTQAVAADAADARRPDAHLSRLALRWQVTDESSASSQDAGLSQAVGHHLGAVETVAPEVSERGTRPGVLPDTDTPDLSAAGPIGVDGVRERIVSPEHSVAQVAAMSRTAGNGSIGVRTGGSTPEHGPKIADGAHWSSLSQASAGGGAPSKGPTNNLARSDGVPGAQEPAIKSTAPETNLNAATSGRIGSGANQGPSAHLPESMVQAAFDGRTQNGSPRSMPANANRTNDPLAVTVATSEMEASNDAPQGRSLVIDRGFSGAPIGGEVPTDAPGTSPMDATGGSGAERSGSWSQVSAGRDAASLPAAARAYVQQEIAGRVAPQVAEAARSAGAGTLQVVLAPEELGTLKVTFAHSDGGLNVTVNAERPDVQEMIRRHIDLLTQELRSAGYEKISMSFGSEGSDASDQAPWNDTGARSFRVQNESGNPAPTPMRLSRDGLDIRL